MLSLRRKNLVGLDIDASAVRMVQFRKDRGGYVIVKAAVTEITPWGGDPQLRKIHTVQAILQGLSSAGITSKYAVCGLRGPEVVVRDFEFPAMTPEEIAGAVELEVSQICPFLAEESTFDYQVTSNNDKRTMGFWVAATNDLIESTRQLVAETGLHCALVDVVGLALLNLLGVQNKKPKAENEEPQTPDSASCPAPRDAVLSLGDSCISIAIADPGGRPFVRDVGSGVTGEGRPSLAAGRLATHGSFATESGWAARHDYRPMTNDSLVEDVTTTLRYYAAQNGSARVDRLLVCGGSPATQESVELLRTRVNLEVQPWNPLTDCGLRIAEGGLKDAHDDTPPWYGPSLAVAAGLAMRNI
ncbi:MAG: pilus assembly protein PilM [Phycisphaerae bacterium]|nr:pilus assembly protein PilM [Phycisphaerae bacterium]